MPYVEGARAAGTNNLMMIKGGLLRRHVANVHAVEDVSFTLKKGETLSLVGESGCGKSSCGRSILRLVEPTSGSVLLDGRDVLACNRADLRRLRREMQMIFQDPFASLNPYMRLFAQVAEPLRNFDLASGPRCRIGSHSYSTRLNCRATTCVVFRTN